MYRDPAYVARAERAATIASVEAWRERWLHRAEERRAANSPWPKRETEAECLGRARRTCEEPAVEPIANVPCREV